VFARAQGRLGCRAMEIVVQADIDRVDIIARQQLAQIGVNIRDVADARGRFRRGLIDVGNRHNLDLIRHLRVLRQMIARDLPATDDANTDFLFFQHCAISSVKVSR